MFGTISDPALSLAASVGASALGMTLVMSVVVIALRVRAIRNARRHADAVAHWRPLLVRIAAGEDVALPRPARHEHMPLLLLWNQMQESLRGEAHERLNVLGARLGLYARAQRMARGRHLASRVIGHASLGQFASPADWPRLLRAMHKLHTPVSLAAARALLRIDAKTAAPILLQRYLAYDDWPAPRVGTLLRESPHDAIGSTIARRLIEGNLYEQLRLLPLLRFADVVQVDRLLDRIVRISREPQVLSIALRQLRGPGALSEVRGLAGHEDPLVRSAAAQALGRIGNATDENLLMTLMADANWWVRYRAAQALVGMPRVTADDMVQLRRITQDRYARDMLAQALAERGLQIQATHVGQGVSS